MKLILSFLLALPLMGYDFSLSIEGPQTAWKGQPIRLQVQSALLDGARDYVQYDVRAPGSASFPVLVATCCGPTRAWQPGDTELVVTPTTVGSQPITLTATSGGVTRTASFTLEVREMPEANSFKPVSAKSTADIATWEANMEKGRRACQLNVAIHESQAWYYDGLRVFQQLFDYTGDKFWLECAEKSKALYRAYVLDNEGKIPGYRVFPHGLYRDAVEGDEESKRAVLALAANSAYARAAGGIPAERSRETAYLLNARRLANQLGADYDLTPLVAAALGHLDQWERGAYVQPFMVGLTAEALIDTGDVRVLEALQPVLDMLWTKYWVPSDQAFRYDGSKKEGSPDLNLLIAPAFAWVYRMTGDAKYLDRGDQIFNGGQRAYLDGGKQFSQNYRWSFDYLEWVAPDTATGPVVDIPMELPSPDYVTRDELNSILERIVEALTAR